MIRNDERAYLLRQQSALALFGEFALKTQNVDEILTRACEIVRDALNADFAKVMELQRDGTTLLVRAGVGWSNDVVGKTTVIADVRSSEGHALHTGKPVISNDITKEDRFEYADFIKEAGIRALANVIVIGPAGRGPYGLLQVDSLEARDFTESDTEFLRSYANLLAAAVDRLRITQEMLDAQDRLRVSEEHFRATAELNPQIPWTADATGAVTGFDQRWLILTGLSQNEALGWGWQQVPHADDLPMMEAAWNRSIATGQPFDIQVRLKTADAGYRWFRVQAFAQTDDNGEIVRWYGTVEDIRERRQLEEALRQLNNTLEARVLERTQALESEQRERQTAEEHLHQSQKMEAVGQLTGGLAHDFNNLLAGITGSLEVVRMLLKQRRSDEIERFITAGLTSAHRAAALTHRLLAFSRRQTLEPKPTNANQLIAGLEDLIRGTVGPAIKVSTHLVADSAPIVCDPNQLENALLNLSINARDAMPNGGTLEIRTESVEIDATVARRQDFPPGSYVKISVTDSGVGMSPEIVRRAFDPFFTTKPLGEGTGLGLSMIYGFAKQSGGQVRIHSAVCVGTTVSIFLPQQETESVADPATATAHEAEHAEHDETVLVVDDDDVVRMVTVEMLGALGYVTRSAADGASALAEIKRMKRIDLLLTDVGLPGGLNGRQVADAARQIQPGLRVLFITGFADAAVIGGNDLAPGMSILTKPFSAETLAERVRKAIEA
ncbi:MULTISPECIES: ATP-binding protein [unclassified Caballeronia]|uniref:ATP-binding protein n=1 Tax=unclassified Caballeronia TaxID=2646786 RepID=UPI002028631C|nr:MULTISPECIES: ATP-binding protein [unclassified Caballeronia]